MTLFIGMDEAGYGPLLGPLVVGCAELVCADAEPALPIRPARGLRVGDSKEILQRRGGLAELEAVVLGFHAALTGAVPASLVDWLVLDPRADAAARLGAAPWYARLDLPLPFAAEADQVARAWEAAEKGELLGGARARRLVMRIMGERELNDDWARTGNKHTSLFNAMIEVLEERLGDRASADAAVRVSIDKLGGRNYYEPLLVGAFPFVPCEILDQSRGESRYRLELERGPAEFRFLMKGDSRCAEIALASMVAKYAREALMRVFNDYWTERAPGIRPTAGYYEDGRRFLDELRTIGGVRDDELAGLERRR